MLNCAPCQNMFKYLVPVNVTLFENRIFIDIINLRCHNGLVTGILSLFLKKIFFYFLTSLLEYNCFTMVC